MRFSLDSRGLFAAGALAGAMLAGAMPFVGFAKPEKIASVFAFLGSDDARFINGTEIRAAGGALS